MPELSDKELLNTINNGNKNYGFYLLVTKYQERLYWHIRKIVISHEDSDDVMQNTFIKAWNNINNFREEATLYTWLYRIATNESLNLLKKKKRRFFIPFVDVKKELANSLESDEYFTGDEIQKKLQKAILKLPEKQRVVFNMRYFDEMKYQDIAQVLNSSEGALKASYHHAVKKVEETLKNETY